MTSAPAHRWRVAGASVQGGSHKRNGQPCQDSSRWDEIPGGVLVAAVADGAGSAECSEIGASLAVTRAMKQACTRLANGVPRTAGGGEALLYDCFRAARDELIATAESMSISLGDLATTLLLAVVTPDRLVAGQVGDGAIVARLPDDSFSAVTRPPVQQEYVNETSFLTSDTFLERAQFVVHPHPVTGVALFTDGLQMLALRMPQALPHPAFFSPLLRLLAAAPEASKATEHLRGFLESPQIAQRTHDDLTLVLAVPEGE